MTLRMLAALIERERERTQWQEVLFAQLTAATINFGFCRPKKLIDPEILMPSRFCDKEKDVVEPKKKHRMTVKQRDNLADNLRAIMAQYHPKSAPSRES